MSYEPSENAKPLSQWDVVFLSHRDVNAQIPINFLTQAGVSIQAACFANGVYDTNAAQTCISNLIGARFERFVLDLYWDHGLRQYNLCPVQFPLTASRSTSLSHSRISSATRLSTVLLTRTSTTSKHTTTARQSPVTTAAITSAGTLTGSTSITGSSTSTAPTVTLVSTNGDTLDVLGPYQCAESLNLPWVLALFNDYFQKTSNTVSANFLFFQINLHAAASSVHPNLPTPAPVGQELPGSSELLSGSLDLGLPGYMYTPEMLQDDRLDLNASWFDVPLNKGPIAEYYTISDLSNGQMTTENGWPSTSFVLLTKAKRLLLSWGTIDPQMKGYDFAGDASIIFDASAVTRPVVIDSNGAGDLISGCFFRDDTLSLAKVNSSWAQTKQFREFPALTNNITSCGISPVLNATLDRSAADYNPGPYSAFVQASIWSWAAGEPRNTSGTGTDMDDTKSQKRCALLDPNPAYKGHWRAEDCQLKYPVACRVDNQPYEWRISTLAANYGTAPFICDITNTTFDVPRTGLENTYLYQTILGKTPASHDDPGAAAAAGGVWINFNSLDVEGCWVRGVNATCPYYEDPGAKQQREILVPTIGALILLILTVLTLFVKCNVNRRNSRVRKRGGDWYDGIPA